MLQNEFDYELGESAVDDLCIQHYSQYGDCINEQTAYDIIDQIGDEIKG